MQEDHTSQPPHKRSESIRCRGASLVLLHSSNTSFIMTEHPEYEMEELVALLRKEDNHHYWSSSEAETGGLAQAWRHKICDWFYELVDHYNFDREVVGIALHYFDRYIAKRSDGFLVREKYQLAAMSALFLAIKIHGVSEDGSSAKIKALSRLCYGHFEGEQVLAAEKDILVALEWFIHPPSMHQVAMAFSQVHPLRYVSPSNNSYVYEAARFQCELAVFLPDLLQKYKPSEIVFAAMLNATEKVDPIVLTSQMKNQFMSLLHLPELGLDESKVAEVKAYMKRSFPVPDLSMNLSPDLVEEPQERLSSVSPTNVSEF